MKHKLLTLFILLWYSYTCGKALAQVQLPDGVWNELLSANDGSATIDAANDEKVSALFKDMVGFLCTNFDGQETSPCSFQHTEGAYDAEITTYAFDHIFRGAHFQAMLSLHPLKAESHCQLWQLYFVHFPERDEMYEIRIYQNPLGNNEALVLWKTDIFSSSYYIYGPGIEAVTPDFVVSTTPTGQDLSFEKPWAKPLVEIFDLTGQAVYRSNGKAIFGSDRKVIDRHTEIETTGWVPGIYIMPW